MSLYKLKKNSIIFLRQFSKIFIVLVMLMITFMSTSCVISDVDNLVEDNRDREENDFFYIKEYSVSDVLLNYDDLETVHLNPELSDTVYYENELKSLRWIGSSSITINSPMISNWTEYDTLKFAVYSENKTNTAVQLRFNNNNSKNTPMAPYFRYLLKIDFTGWKIFEIRLYEMSGNYNANWNAITSVSFDCKGWGLEPNEKNILYFGNFYLCKTKYNIKSQMSINDSALYESVLQNWKKSLVGNENHIPKIKEYTSRVKIISEKCEIVWEDFKRTYNGERDSAWNIKVLQNTNGGEVKIGIIYSNILTMAIGYATRGSTFYQDEDLFADIRSALEYSYNYYYGENIFTEGTYGNWWHWEIGIPLSLTRTLIVLHKELPRELLTKYLSPVDYLDLYPSMSACNKVWITYCVLASAILQMDCERILIAQESFEEVFEYVSFGDGFYHDGSFIQHDKFPYTGGYGISMLEEITNLLYIFRDTPFEFNNDKIENHYNWIFESFQPIIYEGNLFSSVRGREVYRNISERVAQYSVVTSMIKMQAYAPANIKIKLENLIRHYMLCTGQNYTEDVPLPLVEYTVNLYKNRFIKKAQSFDKVKVFGNMDRIVQHRPKYGVSLSFSSDRIYKYESINNENRNGWYQGDGMIHLYTNGYDYGYNFYNYVNPYLLPGTTVTSQEREIKNLSKNIFNGSPFAGGVEFGSYGIGAFELGYAKGNGVFESNIAARKSYFMFDDEIVAVGSGINDDSSTMVRTVVENRLWRDEDVFTVSGKNVSASTQEEDTDAKYMHFTNMGGYVFLNGTTTKYKKAENTNSFLEIVIEHGKNPADECYSYVYLPEATARQTKKYSAKPDVEIIAQSESVHIVQEKTLGITGYVFYESGSAYGITVDNPCVIMIGKKKGKTTVSISEPTQHEESLTVRLELDRVKKIVDCDQKMEGIVSDGVVSFSVDTAGSCGRTFTATLK